MIANKRGMTLIEIIIVIVVLSIAMLPLLVMYSNVVSKSAEGQFVPTAALLGQDLIEEIESKYYDEVQVAGSGPPWTLKQNLGIDAGEVAVNKNTFDDVDDFKDWTESTISGYPNYSSSVEVYYVNADDLDNHQNPDPPIANNEYTDFKKIIVTISHSQIGDIELVTVMQGY